MPLPYDKYIIIFAFIFLTGIVSVTLLKSSLLRYNNLRAQKASLLNTLSDDKAHRISNRQTEFALKQFQLNHSKLFQNNLNFDNKNALTEKLLLLTQQSGLQILKITPKEKPFSLMLETRGNYFALIKLLNALSVFDWPVIPVDIDIKSNNRVNLGFNELRDKLRHRPSLHSGSLNE